MSPTWRKPDAGLVELLDATVAGLEFDAPVDYRPMFGCPPTSPAATCSPACGRTR